MNIGMCIGNGLTIDLQNKYSNYLKDFNTYHFFDWDIKTPNKDKPFIEDLSLLREELNQMPEFDDDFKAVYHLLSKYDGDISKTQRVLFSELQHFLTIAFATFQMRIDTIDIQDWVWVDWFSKMRSEIKFGISFNYDLVLERALEYAEIPYRRVGINNVDSGIYILKPHGSIDFESGYNVYDIGEIQYPLKNFIYRNNTPIRVLHKENLLSPRVEMNIVLPLEYSKIMEYQWVKPGYDAIKKDGKIFTHFIFIGVSYHSVDQEEINTIIDSLNSNTKIIIANPCPSAAMLDVLYSKFSNVEIWRNGPEKIEV